MGGRGSGGANRLPVDLHLQRGTFRPDRHVVEDRPIVSTPPAERASGAPRRRTLAGLSGVARRIAVGLLDTYGQWDEASLRTLRSYAKSSQRLEEFEAAGNAAEVRREARINLALLKALGLEK